MMAALVMFSLHADDMKFNMQEEDRMGIQIVVL